jgi:hypothetical protein
MGLAWVDLDRSLPGARRLYYWFACRLNHRPGLWRVVAALLRRWPGLLPNGSIIARTGVVTRLLRQPHRFLNSTHARNAVAGEFLIGMDFDQRYRNDHRLFTAILSAPEQISALSAVLASKRCRLVAAALEPGFDLVNDYLIWVVYHSLRQSFGAAGQLVSATKAWSASRKR